MRAAYHILSPSRRPGPADPYAIPVALRGLRPLPCLLLTGCNHAPSQNILGSYFPAWMLCAAGGIGLTVVVRLILVGLGADAFVPARLVTYAALAAALTILLWLWRFGQ